MWWIFFMFSIPHPAQLIRCSFSSFSFLLQLCSFRSNSSKGDPLNTNEVFLREAIETNGASNARFQCANKSTRLRCANNVSEAILKTFFPKWTSVPTFEWTKIPGAVEQNVRKEWKRLDQFMLLHKLSNVAQISNLFFKHFF